MDNKFQAHLRKKGANPDKARMPKHIALTVGGLKRWTKTRGEPLKRSYMLAVSKINDIIKYQIMSDIPIFTVYFINNKINEQEEFSEVMDVLSNFFKELFKNRDLFDYKIKVSVLGKWYSLPNRVVEPIKRVIDETKDYDSFFLNLCINYDGKEEIVDAVKVLLRKAMADKINVDNINQDMIKDNIYSSYFLPPDMIIKTGTGRRLHGYLLWDSTKSTIYFSDVLWNEFCERDLAGAIKYYQENNSRM